MKSNIRKTKVKKLKDFKSSTYACRGCLNMTNKIYTVKNINVIACCPDCARDAVECMKDKRPWVIPQKMQNKMSKEQLDGIYRFWNPIDKYKYPTIISKKVISK